MAHRELRTWQELTNSFFLPFSLPQAAVVAPRAAARTVACKAVKAEKVAAAAAASTFAAAPAFAAEVRPCPEWLKPTHTHTPPWVVQADPGLKATGFKV